MKFTIPATKYTKAIMFNAYKFGIMIAFVDNPNRTTKGDNCIFWNQFGLRQHEIGTYKQDNLK